MSSRQKLSPANEGDITQFRILSRFGSAQEFVKVCNWRGFQNAGLRRLGDGFAMHGPLVWRLHQRRWSRTETFQAFFSFGEVPPKPWEESVRL